ncbi:ArsJ-associated glyceraldehyde-3-phosphate dehydrogenase [Marinobacteraceae bacterium S3BR75-40.1]
MNKIKVGINGFGRIGRLATRILSERSDMQLVHVNDPGTGADTLAHLLNFDSIYGRWQHEARAHGETLHIGDQSVQVTHNKAISETDWSDCDLVLECSGKMRKKEVLQGYLDQGIGHVVVSAPVPDIPNIVLGVNDDTLTPDDRLLTAASCTTNCLAPVVKVIHEQLGIKRGSMTTIHGLTNDQVILDAPHKDPRRARAAGQSMIPTTTNSAKAITAIFPELTGHLNGIAVRVPVTNASLTDCVFDVEQETTVEEVNEFLKAAADGDLAGILDYEERPLVSCDFRGDSHSSIVDGLSTLVIDKSQVRIYAWYDNEWGYSNRLVELAAKVGQ